MKDRSAAFTALDDLPTRAPRYVVAVSFDADDTDRLWLTSAADAALPAGTAAGDVVHGCIPRGGISGKTQVLRPETGASSIGSVSFKFQDIGGAISARVFDRLSAGASWRHQHIQVFIGHQGLAWDDYTPALTLLVDDHKIKDGVIYLRGRDPGALAKTDIFVGHQTTLAATVAAADTTIPITSLVPGHFPVLYHPPNYSYDAGQACGYVKIKDEIIKHFGVNAAGNAFEGVERGALGTLAAAYTIDAADPDSQKLAIAEYIAFEGLAVEWHYALQVGLLPAGHNLINDAKNFGEFTQTGGSGVLVDTGEVGPVPWANWYDVIDDAAVYEVANYTHGDFVVDEIYTGSIVIKHDPAKTKTLYLRLSFLGLVGSYAEVRLTMSTGSVTASTVVGDATTVSAVGVLLSGYWFLRVSASCSNASATGVQYSIFPAVNPGGAVEVQTVQAALPFLGEGDVYGWYPIPAHWSLGIDPRHVDIDDYYNIGADLWAPSLAEGKRVRFWNVEAEEARKFMREQLGVWLGVFQPVYGDGRLGLRRLGSVLPYSSYDAYLSDADLIGYGSLQHDHGALINVIVLHWNWARATESYNNKTFIIDSTSIEKYGEAPIKEYKFRGVYHGAHSDEDLLQYFDSIRDRFVAPPVKIQVTVPARWARLDPGDRVRLKTAHVWDSNAGGPLDRSLEVQAVKIDWLRGRVTLDLFGGVERSTLVRLAQNINIADAFLTPAAGTNIATLPGAVFAGNVLTSDHVLTGHDTDATQAVYYYDGNLEISGTLTLTGNVALYCTGDITISGLIDGVGGGAAGGAGNAVNNDQVLLGQPGGYGKPHSAGGLNIRFGFPGLLSSRRDRLDSTYQLTSGWRFVRAELTPPALINHNGSSLIGLARLNLRGSGGAGGQSSYFTDPANGNFNQVAAGGDGGAGGAGLLIVARGLSFSGGLGAIDLSGADGQQGAALNYANVDPVNPIAWGGSGAGGAAGACLVILDGTFTAPNRSRIIQNDGATPVPAGVGSLIYREGSQLVSHHVGQIEARPWYSHRTGSPGAAQPDRLHIMPMPEPNDGGAWLEAQAERQAASASTQNAVTQYGGEILNINQQWTDITGAEGTDFSNALNVQHGVADDATVNNIYTAASSSPPASPVVGDFWRQADTGHVYTREAGGWALAATQNLVTRSASSSPPASPIPGDFWVQTDTGQVLTRGVSDWESAATQNQVHRAASSSPPASPIPGDFWVQTDTGQVLTRGVSDWESAATQNQVHRAASSSPPSSPIPGDFWVQTDTGRVLTRGASAWQAAATHNQVTHAASPPASPVVGDMWHDTGTGVYAAWDGGAWDPVATEGADWDVNVAGRPADVDILNNNLFSFNTLLTVGSGGDYSTFQDAIADLSKKRAVYLSGGSRVNLQLKSGYKFGEAILFDSVDLSFIDVTSVDSIVQFESTVNDVATGLVFPFGGSGQFYARFAAVNGAKSPVFDINITNDHRSIHGSFGCMFAAVGSGSMIRFGANRTIKYFAYTATNSNKGIVIGDGGVIQGTNLVVSNFSVNAYGLRSGVMELPGVDLRHCFQHCAFFRDGARLNAINGVFGGNGTIAIPDADIEIHDGSVADLTGGVLDAPAFHGVISNTGEVVCKNFSCTNVPAGSYAFKVEDGGVIKAAGATGSLSQAANQVTASGVIYQ